MALFAIKNGIPTRRLRPDAAGAVEDGEVPSVGAEDGAFFSKDDSN